MKQKRSKINENRRKVELPPPRPYSMINFLGNFNQFYDLSDLSDVQNT